MPSRKFPNTVPADILEDVELPEYVVIGKTTYGLEWYEAEHGQRGVVMYGPKWSGSTACTPGEKWAAVRSSALDAARISKAEYGY